MRWTGILVLILGLVSTQAMVFSVGSNFKVSLQKGSDELAHCRYEQQTFTSGMNTLHIYINQNKGRLEQYRGAGFLEGYATFREVFAAYRNLQVNTVKGPRVSLALHRYLSNQLAFIDKMVATFERDQYWQMIGCLIEQVRYAYRGYLQRINEQGRPDMNIPFTQFYYLTNQGDFQELIPALHDPDFVNVDRGTGYVKAIGEEDTLYTTHSSIHNYDQMVRVSKSYHFPSEMATDSITFSSRPGEFHSRDGFYVLSSGMKITRTTLVNHDKGNYEELSEESLPAWMRAMAANWLASDPEEWVTYFSKFHSGTFNSQWMIVNEKAKNIHQIITFVQQAFSLIRVTPMSNYLIQNRYIGSYNVAVNEQIEQKLLPEDMQLTTPYDQDQRARILKRYSEHITSETDLQLWLRNNDLDLPNEGLAPRADLKESNPYAWGQIDCKIAGEGANNVWMIVGPTTSPSSQSGEEDRFQSYKWSQFPNINHEGMAQEFNFSWQLLPIDPETRLSSNQNLQTQ